MNLFSFQEFKSYAAYLLKHKLDEAALLILEASKQATVPILQKLSHLSHQQLLALTKESLQGFLENALTDKALQQAQVSVDTWKNNLSPLITREGVELADIVLVYHNRKKILVRLLQGFTSELPTALKIVEELDDFYAKIEQYAFGAYLDICQQKLKKERDFVASLINHSVNGVLAFDTELRLTTWNKVLEDWNALKKERVLGQKIFELFPGYEHTPEGKAMYEVLKGEKIKIREQPYRDRKGYYEADSIPLFDDQGEVIGGFSIIRDITEHKLVQEKLKEQTEELATINEELREHIEGRILMEEQLRQSRDYYLTILEDFPGLIWRSNLEAKRDYFNKTWLSFTGRSLEEEYGDGWIEGVHPEDKNKCVDIYMNAFKAKQSFNMEYRLRRHDGQYRWITDFGKPLCDTKREFKGFIGVCFDIEEQKQAQKKIKDSQHFIERITHASPSVIFVVDVTSLQIIYTNQDALKLLSYTKGLNEVHQLSANDGFIHPDDMDRRNAYYASLREIKDNEVKEVEYRVKDAKGEYRTFLTRSVLFEHDGQGSPQQVMGISIDVTSRAKMEEELQQKNLDLLETYKELRATKEKLEQTNNDLYQTNTELEKRVERRTIQLMESNKELNRKNEELRRTNIDLDNFIYTASHDLRSPIANLEGIINILSRKLAYKLQEREQVLLNLAGAGILKLKKTINDLTDIAKVQKGLDAQVEILSFEQIYKEAYEDMISLATHAGAHIQTHFEIAELQYARKNLKSIFYNLLSNAIKYRSAERELQIQVSTYQDGKYTVLSVTDNGLGIPEKGKDKLFKMFKRLHSHVEGTGIGLYIVKRVVENNGGKIEVESQEGQGSTFRVYFPVKSFIPLIA